MENILGQEMWQMVNFGVCRISDLVKLVYGTAGGYVGYDTGDDVFGDTTTPLLVA